MPIKFNEKFGAKTTTLVHFDGKLLLAELANYPDTLMILDETGCENPCFHGGNVTDEDPVTCDELTGHFLTLKFDKVESIDLLIAYLKKIRHQMTGEEPMSGAMLITWEGTIESQGEIEAAIGADCPTGADLDILDNPTLEPDQLGLPNGEVMQLGDSILIGSTGKFRVIRDELSHKAGIVGDELGDRSKPSGQ